MSPADESAALDAVHDDDLDGFLEGIGVLSRFNAGRETCAFCGDLVHRDNLYAVFPDSGQVKFACDRPECVVELTESLA